MAAPRWISVAFLLTLGLELCFSHRPLTLDGAMNSKTKDEAQNTDTMSKNVIKDGAIGTECANNNCDDCNYPGCDVQPPYIVPTPCLPPLPPTIIPPIDSEPCLPPVPPIIIEPPFNCPEVEPCPRCDICIDYSKMDPAMASAPAS